MPDAEPNWRAAIARLDGAYADSTLRCYRADAARFAAWANDRGLPPFPATPEMVADFVTDTADEVVASTMRRRMSGLKKLHRLLRLPCPVDDEEVRIALRRAYRQRPRRRQQALGLTRDLRDRLLAVCGNDLQGLRDQALIRLGYDTLCRRGELVAIRVEDLSIEPDGAACILIRRSKADPYGEGRFAYAETEAMRAVNRWLSAARITDGAILRTVREGVVVGNGLNPYSISRRLKRLGEFAGLPADTLAQISGHSMRVGAAQDLAAEGYDLIALMTLGGWKTPHVVARYVEKARIRRVMK